MGTERGGVVGIKTQEDMRMILGLVQVGKGTHRREGGVARRQEGVTREGARGRVTPSSSSRGKHLV